MATGLLAGACSTDVENVFTVPEGESGLVDRIAVCVASHKAILPTSSTRADGDKKDFDDDDIYIVPMQKEFDPDTLLAYSLNFNNNSIIQVSQQTATIDPFDTEEDTYDFQFIPGSEDASWDDENSYNFGPYFQDDPLEWNKIGEKGSYNAGFALYAMYFPIENKIRSVTDEVGAIHYYVMEDQSTLENLMKSDILGAYHSTGALFSRIRFRLFHLMTYLRVRLYVPVYDDVKHNGFRENALLSASLDNVTPYFAIDWKAVRSSDTQGPAVTQLNGNGSIIMYQHPLPKGSDHHPIVKLEYKKYLSDNYFDQGITGDYDYVRIYDFSVILPNQRGTIGEDGKEIPFTATDFLNFYFQTNSGGRTRYFFNQSTSANSDENVLDLSQGNFQYLELYVPRVGNQAIFVGAEVKPWNHKATDMFLTPKEVEE